MNYIYIQTLGKCQQHSKKLAKMQFIPKDNPEEYCEFSPEHSI